MQINRKKYDETSQKKLVPICKQTFYTTEDNKEIKRQVLYQKTFETEETFDKDSYQNIENSSKIQTDSQRNIQLQENSKFEKSIKNENTTKDYFDTEKIDQNSFKNNNENYLVEFSNQDSVETDQMDLPQEIIDSYKKQKNQGKLEDLLKKQKKTQQNNKMDLNVQFENKNQSKNFLKDFSKKEKKQKVEEYNDLKYQQEINNSEVEFLNKFNFSRLYDTQGTISNYDSKGISLSEVNCLNMCFSDAIKHKLQIQKLQNEQKVQENKAFEKSISKSEIDENIFFQQSQDQGYSSQQSEQQYITSIRENMTPINHQNQQIKTQRQHKNSTMLELQQLQDLKNECFFESNFGPKINSQEELLFLSNIENQRIDISLCQVEMMDSSEGLKLEDLENENEQEFVESERNLFQSKAVSNRRLFRTKKLQQLQNSNKVINTQKENSQVEYFSFQNQDQKFFEQIYCNFQFENQLKLSTL